jgi:hypothetical protein
MTRSMLFFMARRPGRIQPDQNVEGSVSDNLKTALELALEKLEREAPERIQKLSEPQRKSITQTRKKYQAKIAEKQLGTEAEISKATRSGEFTQIEVLQNQLVEERKHLERALEAEIQQIRDGQND